MAVKHGTRGKVPAALQNSPAFRPGFSGVIRRARSVAMRHGLAKCGKITGDIGRKSAQLFLGPWQIDARFVAALVDFQIGDRKCNAMFPHPQKTTNVDDCM